MKKDTASVGHVTNNSKASILLQKVPFLTIGQSYPSSGYGSIATEKGRGWSPHHRRTSSESHLIAKQPFWLDEPENLGRKIGHRRSSSDSLAYTDVGSQDLNHFSNAQHASFILDPNPVGKRKNRAWDVPESSVSRARGFSSPINIIQGSGSALSLQKADGTPFLVSVGKEEAESSEKNDSSHGNPFPSEMDTIGANRARQLAFAESPRVRKLEYIAKLERTLQALQAEAAEVYAQLELVNHKALIQEMRNVALREALEIADQEKLENDLALEASTREVASTRARIRAQYPELNLD